jgi:PAS domain S-box-containing protein
MSNLLSRWRFKPTAALNYSVAVASMAAALAAGLLLDASFNFTPSLTLFLCAIMFVAWYGGTGPGLFAAVLAILAYDYFFIDRPDAFALSLKDFQRVVLFALAAVFVVWLTAAQRATAKSLRRARDDLQTAVQDLARLNDSLEEENAERRRAEQQLRRNQTYLDEAQCLSQTGSFAWNIAREKIVFSKEAYRIFGVDPSVELSVEIVVERIHPDDRAFVQTQISRALNGESEFEHEHRTFAMDGSIRQLRVRARRVKYETGEEEILGAVMDVTVTRKAEEALNKAQTELAHATRVTTLGEMSASIAHEVNQPLTAIMVNGDAGLRWLNRAIPDLAEVREALKRIVSEAHRASEVIRRIRDLSKKANPQMSKLDINDIIGEALPLIKREALNHRVTLRVELAANLPPVCGDRIQLQQVIFNLAINGFQALSTVTDRPRVLSIRTQKHDDDQVLVAVEDVGVGIEPEDSQQLFSPFYTTKPDGMGMGLSICRAIVEAHGGRLWAQRNDGPGMTFQFTLCADEASLEKSENNGRNISIEVSASGA